MNIKRNNVFETNSSSTHALTVGTPNKNDYIPYGKNIKIEWFNKEKPLTTLKEKVSYLVSHIASWYVYDAENYEDLIEQVKGNWDFQKIQEWVKNNYDKEIVFPKYKGNLEEMIEINHQLISWNHSLNEILSDIIDREPDYLDIVLKDGNNIEFGRD